MLLHLHKEEFDDLAALTAEYVHIPVSAVRRDYYIVMILQQLEMSEYAD